MKELVAGNYFVKKESVLLYIVIEGIGTFLRIAKAIVLENQTVYSETDILLDFQKDPSSFTIVEESSIWPKPELIETQKQMKKGKEKPEVTKKEYIEEDIPSLTDEFIQTIKIGSLELGRVDTVNNIMNDIKVEKELAELIYQKYA